MGALSEHIFVCWGEIPRCFYRRFGHIFHLNRVMDRTVTSYSGHSITSLICTVFIGVSILFLAQRDFLRKSTQHSLTLSLNMWH